MLLKIESSIATNHKTACTQPHKFDAIKILIFAGSKYTYSRKSVHIGTKECSNK